MNILKIIYERKAQDEELKHKNSGESEKEEVKAIDCARSNNSVERGARLLKKLRLKRGARTRQNYELPPYQILHKDYRDDEWEILLRVRTRTYIGQYNIQ